MSEEIWVEIAGFPNYEVSNLSTVRRKGYYQFFNGKIVKKGKRFKKGRIIQPRLTQGYTRVKIHANGVGKEKMVHRLVAEAFIPNPDNKPCINHIDFNRINNIPSNLEWVTHMENVRHFYANRMHPRQYSHDFISIVINHWKTGLTAFQVSEIMGVNKSVINNLIYRYWKHTKPHSSKYRGCMFKKTATLKHWIVCVNTKYLGSFKTENEAALAYNKEAIKRYGEKARLNIIEI